MTLLIAVVTGLSGLLLAAQYYQGVAKQAAKQPVRVEVPKRTKRQRAH